MCRCAFVTNSILCSKLELQALALHVTRVALNNALTMTLLKHFNNDMRAVMAYVNTWLSHDDHAIHSVDTLPTINAQTTEKGWYQ